MAVGAGAAVANIYYNQPMLGVILRDLRASPAVTGLIPTATQLGYALGLLLLVPLGDRIDRRRLILAQGWALCVAIAAAAAAPDAWALVAASVAVGAGATIAQEIVPYAAELAEPARRGAAVGTVMSGLLLGILLGRAVSGLVGQHAGWRAMFWLGCLMMAAIVGLLALVLPRSRPGMQVSYGQLLGSLIGLFRREPRLRRAAFMQAALFGAFSVFWSVLALRLQAPPFYLGSTVAGLFGLIGAAGVMVAPLAGRLADRGGPQRVITIGILLVLLAWVVFGLWTSLAGLVLGVVLLDLGAQACLISNQTVIYALRPRARNRLNTLFMTTMFLGGAACSALSLLAWATGGWTLVSLLGGALPVLAFAVHRRGI
ncbi:MAG: MFS transporter [Acidisphaera sp.]|nr:MFS transporter [Acidisphaera sp.]